MALLHHRKKLSPREIHDLISLCLSSTRFIFNGCHHTQKASGNSFLELDASTHAKSHKRSKKGSIPSPLPYTTSMHNLHTSLIPSSAIYQFTQMTAVAWCITPVQISKVPPPTPQTKQPNSNFNDCLNAIHERTQFTGGEEVDNSVAFLDVKVTWHEDG